MSSLIAPFGLISASHPLGQSWDSNSLRSREEIDFTDAAGLSLTRLGTDWASLSSSPLHFEFQLSTFQNPIHALTFILCRLSNNLPASFYYEKRLFDLMDEFAQQDSEPLLTILFGLNNESVRAAWSGLLKWIFRADNPTSFGVLANIVLKSPKWMDHCPNHHQLLVMASWFGSEDICNSILTTYNRCKCCLNKAFSTRFSGLRHHIHSVNWAHPAWCIYPHSLIRSVQHLQLGL